MTNTVFGFAAEPHTSWLVTPAVKEGVKVRCSDLSGFLGSWDMKEGGVFFESLGGMALCTDALNLATDYCNLQNNLRGNNND